MFEKHIELASTILPSRKMQWTISAAQSKMECKKKNREQQKAHEIRAIEPSIDGWHSIYAKIDLAFCLIHLNIFILRLELATVSHLMHFFVCRIEMDMCVLWERAHNISSTTLTAVHYSAWESVCVCFRSVARQIVWNMSCHASRWFGWWNF